jgi:hypothetical protein
MKRIFPYTLVVLCLLIFAFTFSAKAQGIGTVEHEMKYAIEAFKGRKYRMALGYFESALRIDPEHGEAHLGMGACYVALKEPEKARPYLEKAAQLNPRLKEQVNGYLGMIEKPAPDETSSRRQISKDPNTGEEIAEYEVGDRVEVLHGGQWNPGKIIKVEGRGKSVYAEVDYTFKGDKRNASFFYNGIRHATASSTPDKKTTSKSDSKNLTLGEYTCSSKELRGGQWVFRPRGSFRLLANGKYTQVNGGGSYKNNAAAKEITFIGGFFGNSDARGKVIGSEQIDIHFDENYWWTCALQE